MENENKNPARLQTVFVTLIVPCCFRPPDEWQYLATENIQLINLRPARNNELADADLLVCKKGLGKLLRRSQQGRPDGAVVRHQPGPKRAVKPVCVSRNRRAFLVHLRVIFKGSGAFLSILRQQRLGRADCFLPSGPAYQAEPETDPNPTFSNTRHDWLKLLGRVSNTQPARAL